MTVTCNNCHKIFSKRSQLNRHLRNIHKLNVIPVSYDKSVWNYKCLEVNCNKSYPQNANLITHLTEVHNKSFENEEFIFANESDFVSWKSTFENNTQSNYVVSRRWTSNLGEVTYYNCNRTKTGKQSSSKKQRRLKSQGSCKLDSACTSQIKLTKNKNQFIVRIQKTHYGHNLELQHLRISKEEKAIIASKLISGVTKTKIIASTRDNKIEESLKRLDLLTHKDVDNIKRSYNIDIKDGRRHCNNAISLDLRVQECKSALTSQTERKKLNSNLIDAINQTFVKLQNSNLSNLSDSTILQIHTHLNVLNNLVSLSNSSSTYSEIKFENDTNESFNKNINPQFRLISTQKKRKRENLENQMNKKKQVLIIC